VDTAFKQKAADRVRHGAYANLKASAVLDFGCDVARDSTVDLAGRRVRQFDRWFVVPLDDVVDLGAVNSILLAMNVRQAPARLHDHHVRPFDKRAVIGVGSTEVEVTVLVHRACLENDHVERIDEAAVIVRDFAEIDRQVVAQPGIVFLSIVTREVHTGPEHVLAVGIGFQHRARLERERRADFYVPEVS
jgi:hypothetical protein